MPFLVICFQIGRVNFFTNHCNGTQRTNSIGIPSLDFRGPEGIVTGDREGKKVASPDNSIWLNTNDMYTTSWLHEVVAHGMGSRARNSHIHDWNENNPSNNGIASIRTVLTTINVPDIYGQYLAEAGRVLLDLSRRQILPEDKKNMKIFNWKMGDDGVYRGVMGESTNTIFDRNGNQSIFDRNGNQQIFNNKGEPKN